MPKLDSPTFTHDEYTALGNTNDTWLCSACLAAIFPFNHFEDYTDFSFDLFDFEFEEIFYPEFLKQKNFNPFFNDPESSHLLMNPNVHPDLNFYTANSQLLSNIPT